MQNLVLHKNACQSQYALFEHGIQDWLLVKLLLDCHTKLLVIIWVQLPILLVKNASKLILQQQEPIHYILTQYLTILLHFFLRAPIYKIASKKHTIAIDRSSFIWIACPISIRKAYKVQLFAGLEVKAMSDGLFQVTKYSFTSLLVNISKVL